MRWLVVLFFNVLILQLVTVIQEYWAHNLHPPLNFADCLARIETMGKKRAIKVTILQSQTPRLYLKRHRKLQVGLESLTQILDLLFLDIYLLGPALKFVQRFKGKQKLLICFFLSFAQLVRISIAFKWQLNQINHCTKHQF